MTARRLAQVVIGCCLAVFVFGFIHYPDAPIRPCGLLDGAHYCGKLGGAHTREEFERFTLWQRTLYISWPFGIIGALYLRRQRIKST
jgi:hypothetical protein